MSYPGMAFAHVSLASRRKDLLLEDCLLIRNPVAEFMGDPDPQILPTACHFTLIGEDARPEAGFSPAFVERVNPKFKKRTWQEAVRHTKYLQYSTVAPHQSSLAGPAGRASPHG